VKKKKNYTRYLIILGVIAILVLLGGKKAGWFGKDVSVKVAVEKVTKKDITEIITANGKIAPKTQVKISPEVPGEIIELPVKEGYAVNKGDLLVVINPEIYVTAVTRLEASTSTQKARLAQAEAQLIEKELDYNRNKKLYESNTIAKSDFDLIEASWKVAQSEVQAARYTLLSIESSVNEAKENLRKTRIYSPISGTVSKLNVEKGERVVGTNQFAGTELMTIADLKIMEVKVEVNENDIVKVENNDTAFVQVDAYQVRKFKGLVTEIASSANTTGTSTDQVTNFNVKILLLTESYNDLLQNSAIRNPFLPGMSATVDIRTETKKDVVNVPIQAVTTRSATGTAKKDISQLEKEPAKGEKKDEAPNVKEPEQLEVVFVNQNGLARQRKVKTGIQDNTDIEITSGLEPGEEIITAPYGIVSRTLKDSTRIEIVKIEELYKVKK
jgi:HlyD family secretion protein